MTISSDHPTAPADSSGWLVRVGNQDCPAADLSTLIGWCREKRVSMDQPVFDLRARRWFHAGNVPELRESLGLADPTTPPAWQVQVGSKRYVAETVEVLNDWCRLRRVHMNSNVYHPTLGAWKPAKDVFFLREAFGLLGKLPELDLNQRLIASRPTVKLLPLLLLGSCGGLLLIGFFMDVHESSVKHAMPARFTKAEGALQSGNLPDARVEYESILKVLESTHLSEEKARAHAGYGTTLALLGDQTAATAAFAAALNYNEAARPPMDSNGAANAAFEAAFEAAQRREADWRARRARGDEPDSISAKSAIKGWVRDNIADPDAEVIDVGSPHKEGPYWVVTAQIRGKNAFGGPVIESKDFYLQEGSGSWGITLYEVRFAR